MGDCSHLNYTTPISEEVLTAAKKIEQKRRGWVDEADKKRKILQLPALHLATKLHGRIDVGKAYDAGNICSVVLSHQLSGCSLYRMERSLMPESRALPTNRSETPTENLEESLLLVLSSENSPELDADVWREAYCRDVEAFSHLLHLDQNERPKNCPQINSSLCALHSVQCSMTVQLVRVEAGNYPWKMGHRNSSTTGPTTGSTGTTPTFWEFAAAAHSQGGQGVALMETASC